MDTDTYLTIYRPMIVIAFIVSTTAFLGYAILAPWARSAIGRLICALLFTLSLVLLVPFLQITLGDLPFRREFSVGAMGLYIIVMVAVSYGIYVTQIRGYLIYRNALRKSNKVLEQEGK